MNTTRMLTDFEAVDITAGTLFRRVLDVAATSTDPEPQTIARAREAALGVLDTVADLLGPEGGRRVGRAAVDLMLTEIRRRGPASA